MVDLYCESLLYLLSNSSKWLHLEKTTLVLQDLLIFHLFYGTNLILISCVKIPGIEIN